MHRMVCLVVCVLLGCGKSERKKEPGKEPVKAAAAAAETPGAPAGADDAPYVVGAGGKRMPAGYVTTFSGPSGPVTIPYTQLSGAHGGHLGMLLSLTAEGGPAKLQVTLAADEGLTSHRELAGKEFTDFDAMKGRPFVLTLEPGKALVAARAAVKIVSASDDAIEGTFTAELKEMMPPDAPVVVKITDGKFRAYPAQIVTKQKMEELQRKPAP